MGHKMDKQQYAKCIEDDIDFLKRNLPKSLFKCLWTSHIIEVLKARVNMIYDQPSLPSGLDEAVDAQMEADGDVDHFVRNGIDEIALKYAKLGAEWMATQNDKDLSEKIAAAYQLGLADKEKQMMSEAVECIVEDWNPEPHPEITIPLNPGKFSNGDRARIIIVKED